VYEKKILRLKKKHGWKSRPGYCVCVLGRGAIRFDFPCDWKVSTEEDAVRIRDREKPDDNCVLAVSRMFLPPVAAAVPLAEMVRMTVEQDTERRFIDRKEAVETTREDGVEIAWQEARYRDEKQNNREYFSRLCIGRGSGIYCLITFDFWVDQAGQFEHVWDEALRSLTFALPVKDPTVGPVIQ
jgi:hypothetical protein